MSAEDFVAKYCTLPMDQIAMILRDMGYSTWDINKALRSYIDRVYPE